MITPDDQRKRLAKFLTILQDAKFHGIVAMKFVDGNIVHITQEQSYKLENPTPVVVTKFDIEAATLSGG